MRENRKKEIIKSRARNGPAVEGPGCCSLGAWQDSGFAPQPLLSRSCCSWCILKELAFVARRTIGTPVPPPRRLLFCSLHLAAQPRECPLSFDQVLSMARCLGYTAKKIHNHSAFVLDFTRVFYVHFNEKCKHINK